eukprot:COSAG04_NODE_3961_length_2396_cov_1.596865_2_plen_121_part_00
MPSKKQRANAAKAKKAAAKAAEPPRQPALEGPRTLHAEIRTGIRAARRAARTMRTGTPSGYPGGEEVARDYAAAVTQHEPGFMNHHADNASRLEKTRERLQAKRISRAAADAASDSRGTA